MPSPREPDVIWELGELLREGPEELIVNVPSSGRLHVALALGPYHRTSAEAGIPGELLRALEEQEVSVEACEPEDARGADVVLAAGWSAAPAVLRLPGLRARAVLATVEEPMLPELGWTAGVTVLGPRWMGGTLPAAASAAFGPRGDHRGDDTVLIHGEEPFGMLVAQELASRRDDVRFVLSGIDLPVSLPFEAQGFRPGIEHMATGFATATVGLAPAVRGWRPAALAMLACGLPTVVPDTPAARIALGDAADLVADPLEAADRVERLLADLELRAERSRAAGEHLGRWGTVAYDLAAELRAL
jgi:hypothetical protein